MGIVAWLKDHWLEIAALSSALVGIAEMITRLTPTKKDDGFVQRIGAALKKILDLIGVPNNLKK